VFEPFSLFRNPSISVKLYFHFHGNLLHHPVVTYNVVQVQQNVEKNLKMALSFQHPSPSPLWVSFLDPSRKTKNFEEKIASSKTWQLTLLHYIAAAQKRPKKRWLNSHRIVQRKSDGSWNEEVLAYSQISTTSQSKCDVSSNEVHSKHATNRIKILSSKCTNILIPSVF
jgi:hypothetical protein